MFGRAVKYPRDVPARSAVPPLPAKAATDGMAIARCASPRQTPGWRGLSLPA